MESQDRVVIGLVFRTLATVGATGITDYSWLRLGFPPFHTLLSLSLSLPLSRSLSLSFYVYVCARTLNLALGVVLGDGTVYLSISLLSLPPALSFSPFR